MLKSRKHLIIGMAFVGFLVVFALTKIPVETIKVFSTVRKTFKQVLLKEKVSGSGGYDVITSASVRVDTSTSSQEQS